MLVVLLGHGKTGSLVGEVARERGHQVRVLRSGDNADSSALTAEYLRDADVVVDFTTPAAAISNIDACVNAGKNMVVGTTGWHDRLPEVRAKFESAGAGLVYGSNFSVGINLFFEIARVSAAALKHGYFGQIFERHHADKKDAPSGTALSIQNVVKQSSGTEIEITSFREGDVVGMHEVVFESPYDDLYLCHDAKSRRAFADGAVRAAEWIMDKKGVYDFHEIWQSL